MLRFIESEHGFKDGLYILLHQSFMVWIFDIILVILLALGIWLFVKYVRERQTYGKLGAILFMVLALFAVYLSNLSMS